MFQSPGPKWEALQEPSPSSDEYDREDGKIDTFGSVKAYSHTRRARDGRASASPNAVVGDKSRLQMKRKESESMFASKKRARYPQDDIDLDGPTKNRRNMGVNSKSTSEQKTIGGLSDKQPEASFSFSSITRKQPSSSGSNSPSTSTNESILRRKSSAMKPPAFLAKPPFESAGSKSNRSTTHDPPSKLAGLSFDNYRRAGRKRMSASNLAPSVTPAPIAEHGKARLNHIRVPSVPQITCQPSTSRTKVILPGVEVIDISEDEDSPHPEAKSLPASTRSSSLKTLAVAPEQVRRHSGNARTASVPSFATKELLPEAAMEVIEIFDSDAEQLSSKVQLLQEKNVGRSSGSQLPELVRERTTVPNLRRGRYRRTSPSGGDSFEGNDGDSNGMHVGDETRSLPSAVPAGGSTRRKIYPDGLLDAPKQAEDIGPSSTPSSCISMHGLKNALIMDSDKQLKRQLVSSSLPRKEGQTLAEAITSAGQLNRTKTRMRRRLQGDTTDIPINSTSDVKDGSVDTTVNETEQSTTGKKRTINAGVITSAVSRRSSRSSNSERLGTAFDEVFGPAPATSGVIAAGPSRRSSRSSNSEGLGAISDGFNSVPATRTPTPEDEDLLDLSSPPKTYGGFRALTWKDFRKDLNNFAPKVYYAKNLPHALQDHINSMSEDTQNMAGMRDLFKATILENTVEDDPDAPSIDIWNNVDTQATPPWEFYYTNDMWLGEGVPPPDIKNLVSCTCKGGCNPKSKTCACLLRQREAASDPMLEFAYDKNGRLKIPGYPIFECNDLCGCSDECRNRVVQRGRKVSVNIAKTEAKGWGVFAGSKKIPGGSFIGIYSGELLTDEVAHERGVKYNKFGRTYLFDIDFHHLRDANQQWENSFTVDAYHAGNFTRFLNHSCDPNCRLYACYINEGNIQKPLLAIFTRRDIEPYEEICFNYQGLYNDDDDDDSDDNNEDKIIDPEDMIYVPCRCGAKNCTGTMFK